MSENTLSLGNIIKNLEHYYWTYGGVGGILDDLREYQKQVDVDCNCKRRYRPKEELQARGESMFNNPNYYKRKNALDEDTSRAFDVI